MFCLHMRQLMVDIYQSNHCEFSFSNKSDLLGHLYTRSDDGTYLMFYDKGSYATLGNFPLVQCILVNIMITTNCTENILCLVDSWYFKLSIDHHL